MDDEMKIDAEALSEQIYENIKKGGKYAEVKVIIERGKTECIPSIVIHNCGPKDVAFLIGALEKVTKHLKNEFPMSAMLASFADINTEELN